MRRACVTAALCVLLGMMVPAQGASAAQPASTVIASADETVPVTHTGDAADDPAIWVNPIIPSRSLVLGNDKRGALETYDLDGNLVQRMNDSTSFWGNVDVRGNLAAVYHRGGVRIYRIDPVTRLLTNATEGEVIPTSGEGLCLYQAANALYFFTIVRASPSKTSQYLLTDANGDGMMEATLRRTFNVGSEAEGCAVDDATGALYLSEENVALWRYGAAESAGTARIAVDTLVESGGHLQADVEGVTVAGDRVIVSSQYGVNGQRDRSYFTVYDRLSNAYLGAFRVGDGPTADDCDGTDGVSAYAGPLGPSYPFGLFVCQDGNNDDPGASQSFKYVRWEAIP